MLLCLSPAAQAQWADVKSLGFGGEPSLAVDGNGKVFLTCHISSRLFVSPDWGATFAEKQAFMDACCDVAVAARPNGDLAVSYMSSALDGIKVWSSTDGGTSMVRGNALSGPLDREWIAYDRLDGAVHMVYSNGYIGGPLSQGVYHAKSVDNGLNYVQTGRIDLSVAPDRAVDPHVAIGDTGRVYALWGVTSDTDTIDRIDFAYSDDGGLSFTGHKTLGAIQKSLGDSQERWMYTCLVSVGKDTVYAFFHNYSEVTVAGSTYRPLLLKYCKSTDGGVTFGPAVNVLSDLELTAAITSYESKKLGTSNHAMYIQTLGWACADPFGRVHVVWQDDRAGQGLFQGQALNYWHVRHSVTASDTFLPSDRVSKNVLMMRPPLDFISMAADKRHVYVSWVESPNDTLEWVFNGGLFIGKAKNDALSWTLGQRA